MADFGRLNISEAFRKQAFAMLLVMDIVLSLFALIAIGVTVNIKHFLNVSDFVSNMMEQSGGGDQLQGLSIKLNYIVSISAIAMVVHLYSIKLWVDMPNYNKREEYKRYLSPYQLARVIFICGIVAAAFAFKSEEETLKTAFKVAETEVGSQNTTTPLLLVTYFTLLLAVFSVLQVCLSSLTICDKRMLHIHGIEFNISTILYCIPWTSTNSRLGSIKQNFNFINR